MRQVLVVLLVCALSADLFAEIPTTKRPYARQIVEHLAKLTDESATKRAGAAEAMLPRESGAAPRAGGELQSPQEASMAREYQ